MRISAGDLVNAVAAGKLPAYRITSDLKDIEPVVDPTGIPTDELCFKVPDVKKYAKKHGLPRKTDREKDKDKVIAWALETNRKHPKWTYEKMIRMAKRADILELSRTKRLPDDSVANDYPPSFFRECFRDAGIREVGWQKNRPRKTIQRNM